MRTTLTLALIAATITAAAQCPHDPVVTPDDAILCPGETVVLSTQPADSYQWLQDGMPIPGAVGQTLTVSADAAGSLFSVIATVDGCAEASPAVLVDAWAFLLPFVIHEGDEPAFIGAKGESYYCPEAFIQLTLGGVGANIQWTLNGAPIPGATGPVLIVTEPGWYSASGAPAVCPDFIMQLGVDIQILFLDPVQPSIAPIDGQLCVYPETDVFQWYLNGSPFAADACFTPAIAGTYTVAADYDGCGWVFSEPYDLILGMDGRPSVGTIRAMPNPAVDAIEVRSAAPLNGAWRMADAYGRQVLGGRFNGCTACPIDLGRLAPGEYHLLPADGAAFGPLRITMLRP